MDIKIVDQTPDTQPEEIKPPQGMVVADDLLQQQVGQLFDLKPSEVSSYKGKLNTLIEYAKTKTEDHSPEGIKWAIRSLGFKLGTPPLGEKWINYITTYAHLSLETREMNQKLEAYEHR